MEDTRITYDDMSTYYVTIGDKY